MTTLWTACGHYLRQARELVSKLDVSQYRTPHLQCFGGTVGGHLRHCIEHFELFQRGWESGCIDYDQRDRGSELERDPRVALVRLEELEGWFSKAEVGLDTPVDVLVDCGEGGDCFPSRSTVGRELQFLVSHIVHHFAIIAVMMSSRGLELPADFGIAPSTLKYQRSLAAGA